MKILPEQMRLYAVTDRTWLHGRKLIDVVSEAIDGGAAFVQLREKSHLEGMELSGEELLAEAKELAQLCHERGVLFVIDDDVELALEAGADGVHVGQEDNPEEARKAQEDGADYLGCGAAFVTGTKLDAKPITAEMMKAVTESVEIPVVAIGGITEDNIPKLTGRGLAGAAVVSAIFAAEDPRKASERLLEKIRQWE